MNINQCHLDTINKAYDDGLITYDEYNRYYDAWTWSAPRHSGVAGVIQDNYYNQHGSKAFWNRINTTRKELGLSEYGNVG